MKQTKIIDWPYFIGLMLLPAIVVALLFLYTAIEESFRYDPAYFTDEFLARYDTPGSVAIALEPVLREGDEEMMAELLGINRSPRDIKARPDLILTFMIDSDEVYFHYLYFDASDYNRLIQYVKKQNGRYITSEMDLHFYIKSGQWKVVAGPVAAAYWSLVITLTIGVYAYRRMRIAREKMYG